MNACESLLLTDLYELTMVHSYWVHRMEDRAVFEFFVRKLPPSRNFLLAAGLEQALEYIETLHLETEEIDWISRCGRFKPGFADYLSRLRFTGDVDAMPEGTPFFADEPILRVTAPIAQAQLLETRLINILQFQTIVASKAVRCVLAARGKPLVDFGLRRAHGAEAGLWAARAAYLAGFSGTSATLAAPVFGIPIFGTMAHSFVQAYDEEYEAFAAYARATPSDVTLLIDTYDTEAAAEKIAQLARRLETQGSRVKGVRIDSGDLGEHARRVRAIFDRAGLRGLSIFASGSLDEYAIERLMSDEAPIDGFGVGTRLVTSSDAPNLDCVYKLQEYAHRPRRKRSEGKATWPGRKQVFRTSMGINVLKDILSLEGDRQSGDALIVPVMRAGKRVCPPSSLERTRKFVRDQINRLPVELKQLGQSSPYPVVVSNKLRDLARSVDERPVAMTRLQMQYPGKCGCD